MGRVDDALRRAAEAEVLDGTATTRPTAPAGIADDIETLAREAFPIEIEEHRKATRPGPTAVRTPEPVTPDLKVRPTYENETPDLKVRPTYENVTPDLKGRPAYENEAPDLKIRPTHDGGTPAGAPVTSVPAPRSVFERIDSSLVGKIVIDAEIAPASREQYRRMAATLHHAQAANGLKVVMVTSAVMGEGKTLTSSNLALTLSESYKKNVLLIDGDLRRPALHTLFRLESSPGLSEGLFAGEDQRLAVRQVSPRLGVLTAGRPSADPIAGLTSPRMARVIEEAREAFDWVIIDTPPVALLPDANLLATMADGVVLVVRAGSTPWDLAQRAVEAVGRERMLGVVLNRSSEGTQVSNYGYYDYYTAPGTDVAPTR